MSTATATMACKDCQQPLAKRPTGTPGPPPDGYKWHAAAGICGPCYKRRSNAARRAAGVPPKKRAPRRRGCTALTGSCACEHCQLAADDTESPLDLGGRWVLDPKTRTRTWQATP